DEPGYMEMGKNLEEPLRPGEEAEFTTQCEVNEYLAEHPDQSWGFNWQETIQFKCIPEWGAAFGVEAVTNFWCV
ncbi:MAG: hypothetical protein U0L09_06830, partial [Christensenellales bacterium]|nr:hypothetical protein [Christensenellales bacterium]